MISSQSFSYLETEMRKNDVKTLETSIEFVKEFAQLEVDTCLSQSIEDVRHR